MTRDEQERLLSRVTWIREELHANVDVTTDAGSELTGTLECLLDELRDGLKASEIVEYCSYTGKVLYRCKTGRAPWEEI